MLKEFRRGSIWWADIPYDPCNPHAQYGNRPVIVISNDMGNTHSPALLVCTITTQEDKYTTIHPHVYGFHDKLSYVQCEQIKVMDKSLIGGYIRMVSPVEQRYVDKALSTSTGLYTYFAFWDRYKDYVDKMQHPQAAPIDEKALELGKHMKAIMSILMPQEEQSLENQENPKE